MRVYGLWMVLANFLLSAWISLGKCGELRQRRPKKRTHFHMVSRQLIAQVPITDSLQKLNQP
jgi:hypothetical protein